jgi:hypothetical protein
VPRNDREDLSYRDALRGSIGDNAAAFGFSVMMTSTYAVLQSILGSPPIGFIFLFAVGAVAGFVALEVIATRGLSRDLSIERASVLAYGALLSFFSVSVGVGAAALVATVVEGDAGFPLGGAAATAAYLLAVGGETLLGREAEH